MQSTTTAPTPFTLSLHQRRCLLQAEFELIELYVDAKNGKTLPPAELLERLKTVCNRMSPATNVARGLLPDGRKPDPHADALPGEDLAAAVLLTDHGIDTEEDACTLLLAALASADPDDEISLPIGPLHRLLEGMRNTLDNARWRAELLRDAALSHLHPGALPQAVQP